MKSAAGGFLQAAPPFQVPLVTSAALEVETWTRLPLVVYLARRPKPVSISPGQAIVLPPKGKPYAPEGFRSRRNRWLDTDAAMELLKLWTAWERVRRARDSEGTADERGFRPALHGLRLTAVVAHRQAGDRPQKISSDIVMRELMVTRDSRFIDQREATESNILMPERVERKGKSTG